MRIGVIGAGHAGVEAAWRASQLDADVVLFSRESVRPYVRPKVVALAFGRVALDDMYLRPEAWYRAQGLDLRLNSPVRHLDAPTRTVTVNGREERFDALVIATGATPTSLPFARQFPEDVIPLWGVRESLAIRDRLSRTRQILILGGGISGVEAALYARETGLEVMLVEKMSCLIPQQLGAGAAQVLARRLKTAGVNVATGRYAATVSKDQGQLHVTLDDISKQPCDLIVTTVGATKQLTLFQEAGLRVDRGIVVDECQQASMPGIFACGDIAQRESVRITTVVRAHVQGRGAGENAVAFVQGRDLVRVPEPVSPLLFKHRDTEIQSAGPPGGDGLVEKVLTNDGETVYRSILLENGAPPTSTAGILRGVQMIGSHEGFRQLMDSLGKLWQGVVS